MRFCKAHDRDRDVTEVWDEIADWWMDAVRDDPGQSADTHDLLASLIDGTGGRTLDLGCGQGQGMRLVGGPVIGADISHRLLVQARHAGPVVRAELPTLAWVRAAIVDRIVSVGLLDLIDDHGTFFTEAIRVTRPDGHLVVVINHPVVTAPDSASLVDPDGEILWRWGTYLTRGALPQHVDAADHVVELFHRPLGELLTTAADAGWTLERMIERGPSAATIERFGDMHGQEQIPTLAGFRWRRTV